MWVIIAIIVVIFILMYNLLKREQQQVKNAFAAVDVILRKRYDLIPNLVETVKAYAKHERDVFDKITELRKTAINSDNADETVKVDNQINQAFKQIFIISEDYPELKSNANFIDLQKALLDVEDELSAARRAYNSAVMEYNISIDSFPSNIVASMFSMQKKEMFVVTDDVRKQIKISF